MTPCVIICVTLLIIVGTTLGSYYVAKSSDAQNSAKTVDEDCRELAEQVMRGELSIYPEPELGPGEDD